MQQNVTEEQIAEFVLAAHNNFAKVQKMYQQNPALLNVRNEKLDETALQGAGHMGNRDIAEYLLAAGAPMTIFAAAMLGQIEFVRDFLEKDQALANAKGVHRISLLYHAALSGKTEIAQLIFDNGGHMDDSALHAAVKFGHTDMVIWLLEKKVQHINVLNFEQKTPWSVASDKGFQGIANLLQKYGGTA